MANPEPSKEFKRPDNMEFKFLFTKTLTEADMETDFVLVGDAKQYLDSLPSPIASTLLYTPSVASLGHVVKRENDGMHVLCKNGWDYFTSFHNIVVGEKIHCWAGYEAGDRILCLLIEKAVQGESSSSSREQAAQEESSPMEE